MTYICFQYVLVLGWCVALSHESYACAWMPCRHLQIYQVWLILPFPFVSPVCCHFLLQIVKLPFRDSEALASAWAQVFRDAFQQLYCTLDSMYLTELTHPESWYWPHYNKTYPPSSMTQNIAWRVSNNDICFQRSWTHRIRALPSHTTWCWDRYHWLHNSSCQNFPCFGSVHSTATQAYLGQYPDAWFFWFLDPSFWPYTQLYYFSSQIQLHHRYYHSYIYVDYSFCQIEVGFSQ